MNSLMSQNHMANMQQGMEAYNHQMGQMQNQIAEQKIEYENFPSKMESFEHGVIVMQNINQLEGLTCCQVPNNFEVYRRDHNGKKKGYSEFKYWEESSYSEKMCLTGSCRQYKLKCFNNQKVMDSECCMRCQKDCTCTYYCCNRQQMICWRSENGQESYLGKIYDPWDCMNFAFKIYDDTGNASSDGGSTNLGNLDYTVQGSCCQCYFWCTCPCDDCNKVEMEIKDQGNMVVGKVCRLGRGCQGPVLASFLETDYFSIDFPKGSNWRQRAMLMNFAVFFDLMVFNGK